MQLNEGCEKRNWLWQNVNIWFPWKKSEFYRHQAIVESVFMKALLSQTLKAWITIKLVGSVQFQVFNLRSFLSHGILFCFYELESFCLTVNKMLELLLWLRLGCVFLLSNHPLETAKVKVLRVSLLFTSRGTILPVNYLDLSSLGGTCRDKAVKCTPGTPWIKRSSEMSKSVRENTATPLVVLKRNSVWSLVQKGKEVFAAQCSQECGSVLTDWWHLRNAGYVRSFQELWLIVIDILNFDYKFRLGLQGGVGVNVHSLGTQGVVRLLLPVQTP